MDLGGFPPKLTLDFGEGLRISGLAGSRYRIEYADALSDKTDWNEFREELERVEIFWGELVGDFDLESGNEDLTKAQVTT